MQNIFILLNMTLFPAAGMKGVPGLVRTGQHGPGGVARGVAGLNPINIKQEPSGGAVQEAPGVYLLCTTIYIYCL